MKKTAAANLLLFLAFLFALPPRAASGAPPGPLVLTADMVKVLDGKTGKGRLYVSGEKKRLELGEAFIIYRNDLGVLWWGDRERRIYAELPATAKSAPRVDASARTKNEIGRKRLGEETVNGHETVKYEVVILKGKKRFKVYMWLMPGTNFPIKTVQADGLFSLEYSNIGFSAPEEVFEEPEGYEKVTLADEAGE